MKLLRNLKSKLSFCSTHTVANVIKQKYFASKIFSTFFTNLSTTRQKSLLSFKSLNRAVNDIDDVA